MTHQIALLELLTVLHDISPSVGLLSPGKFCLFWNTCMVLIHFIFLSYLWPIYSSLLSQVSCSLRGDRVWVFSIAAPKLWNSLPLYIGPLLYYLLFRLFLRPTFIALLLIQFKIVAFCLVFSCLMHFFVECVDDFLVQHFVAVSVFKVK